MRDSALVLCLIFIFSLSFFCSIDVGSGWSADGWLLSGPAVGAKIKN